MSKLYEELENKLKNELPFVAYPIRDLVQILREKGTPITLKTQLTITSIFNSEDVSGILCSVESENNISLTCALSHLIFDKAFPLFKEVEDYQRKRAKRVTQLQRL